MRSIRLLPCLLAALLNPGAAPAQTATWIATASQPASLTRSWFDDSLWDTATAPNGPTATAVFNRHSDTALAPTGQPGGAIAVIEGGAVTLDALSFALPEIPDGQRTSIHVKNGSLTLQGAGIVMANAATYGVANEIYIGPAGQVVLAGAHGTQWTNAQSGELQFLLGGDYSPEWYAYSADLRLRDSATLGQALVRASTSLGALNFVTFEDNASAGGSSISFGPAGRVVFNDHSTAANAQINAYHIYFNGDASAGNARLSPASNFATSSIEFRDRSSAGSATLYLGKLGDVVFTDNSDAGTATVNFTSGAASSRVFIGGNARTKNLTIIADSHGHGRLGISGANQDVELRTLSGNIDIDLGERALLFTDTAAIPGTLGGKISGAGGIMWDRPTTLTISSPDNDFTGLTRVLQGTLSLTNGRTAGVEIGASAMLVGSGHVVGHLHNAGTVSPGSSPGTLQVAEDYFQSATGVLNVEINSASDYDRLNVGGTAALDGTLNLSLSAGYVPVGDTALDFLTAASVTGQFSTVNPPPDTSAALSQHLQYTAKGVRLVVTQHSFVGFGESSAATALGAHLDATLTASTGGYRNLIAQLNTVPSDAQVSAALDALAPDRYSTLTHQGSLGRFTLQTDRERRLATLRARSDRGFDVFFETHRRSLSFDAANGLPSASASHDGGTAGLQWHNVQFSVEFSLTKESGAARLDDLGSRAETESLAPAVSWQYSGERFFLNLSAGVSRDNYDLGRRILYPGVNETATATLSGSRTDMALNIGRIFTVGSWKLTPEVGLFHSDWQADDFAEVGAAGAFAFRDWSARMLHGRLGLEASRPHPTFTPTLTLSWLHVTSDRQSLRAGFVSDPGNLYAVPGRSPDRNLLQAGLSFDIRLGRHVALTLSAAGISGKETRVKSALSAGLRWEF